MSNDNDPTIPPNDGNGAGENSEDELLPLKKDEPVEESREMNEENALASFEAAEATERALAEQGAQTPDSGPDAGAEEQGGMGFIDHLDELRGRLINAGIALIIAAAVGAFFSDFLVNKLLIGPFKNSSPDITLQNLVPYGQISVYLQVIFFTAFVLAFPVLAWQIWKFVEPGLHESEKAASRFIILFISLCFFSGIAFGYFIFLPISLKFFAGFGSTLIANNIAVQDYISFFIGTLLTSGLVFELPFISYVLSKVGLLTPAFMRFYRRHAVVTMLVIAAIVTPSTDMVTQAVIAIPMILLYELSIYISGVVQKKRDKQQMEQSKV